jgi:putative tryptophan/tyrosine transport system permease protein
MALGVYLTFRVLDFPDLTVDGSLPLGAAVCAAIVTAGGDPLLGVAMAFVAGAVAGASQGLCWHKRKGARIWAWAWGLS